MFHWLWKENARLQTDHLWYLWNWLTSSAWQTSTTPGFQNRAMRFSLDFVQINISTSVPFCISNVGVACGCAIGCAAVSICAVYDLDVIDFVISGDNNISITLWGSVVGSAMRQQGVPKFGLFIWPILAAGDTCRSDHAQWLHSRHYADDIINECIPGLRERIKLLWNCFSICCM